MPVQTIPLESLALPGNDQLRNWCSRMEAGDVLYFPQTPVPIPSDDLDFLLGQQPTTSRLHKNVAYKPARDELSGIDKRTIPPAQVVRTCDVMRRYSKSVETFLTWFLALYERRWRLDYASFRPHEEKGRDLPLRRRNDLLHTDAFPTRPTRGWRILRFFHNIHPTRTRDWVIGEPFARVVATFVPGKLSAPRPDSPLAHAGKRLSQAVGLTSLIPQWKRGPYDDFMMRLHNAMKEDSAFQSTCPREGIQFAPGSSWVVYTDTVPHAVLAGQYALEQTLLIDPEAMVERESAPIAILQNMTGTCLV